jgi:hypothetical protein
MHFEPLALLNSCFNILPHLTPKRWLIEVDLLSEATGQNAVPLKHSTFIAEVKAL